MFCLSGLFVLLLARSLVFAGPADLENGTPRGQTSLKKGDVVMLKPQDVTPPIKRIDGVEYLAQCTCFGLWLKAELK